MRILNRTRYPDAEIRAICRRELARSRAGSVIVIERTPATRDLQGHVRWSDRRVRIWLGGEYPYTSAYRGIRAAPEHEIRDWREDLVASAAHEAWHLRTGTGDDRESELAAERHAIARLQLHRRRAPRRGILELLRELV